MSSGLCTLFRTISPTGVYYTRRLLLLYKGYPLRFPYTPHSHTHNMSVLCLPPNILLLPCVLPSFYLRYAGDHRPCSVRLDCLSLPASAEAGRGGNQLKSLLPVLMISLIFTLFFFPLQWSHVKGSPSSEGSPDPASVEPYSLMVHSSHSVLPSTIHAASFFLRYIFLPPLCRGSPPLLGLRLTCLEGYDIHFL